EAAGVYVADGAVFLPLADGFGVHADLLGQFAGREAVVHAETADLLAVRRESPGAAWRSSHVTTVGANWSQRQGKSLRRREIWSCAKVHRNLRKPAETGLACAF